MTSTQLQQWIQHPELLDRDSLYELRTLVARYPYFQSLRLLYLKNLYLLHDDNFGAELRKAVLYVADRRALFFLIEGDRYTLQPHKEFMTSAQKMANEPGVDRTLFLIDAFLASMPEERPQTMELDVTMDYTAYLLQDEDVTAETCENQVEEETLKLRGQELIDSFLNRTPTENILTPSALDEVQSSQETALKSGNENQPTDPETEEEDEESAEIISANDADDHYFTETLAQIYIKQHRYEKALEIIKKLNLNYPKKNAYFADQIRFLEKLIINAKSK